MSFFIAWRYLRSKRSTNAINLIAWISMVAIGVVTAALVVVLSVFNGFEDLVKQMYGDFYADIRISPVSGSRANISAEKLKAIDQIEGVIAIEPVLQKRAILLDGEDKSIVWLKGVSKDYVEFSGLPRHMARGAFIVGDSLNPRLVIGVGVEQALQVVAGQSPLPVTVYLPNPDAGSMADITSALVSSNAFVSGSFAVQQEFDDQFSFTHYTFLQYLLNVDGNYFTDFEVFTRSDSETKSIQKQVSAMLGDGFSVHDRFRQNQSLFAAMQTEKLIIYAIAFLILIIAGFNIISSLTMTVIEKQKDMAVLKAMGITDGHIYRIFLYLGLLLAGLGAIAGVIIGVFISLGQQYFHWIKISGQSFVINYYPVAVRVSDLSVITAIIVCTAVISAWLPARRATLAEYSLR